MDRALTIRGAVVSDEPMEDSLAAEAVRAEAVVVQAVLVAVLGPSEEYPLPVD
jgi:hypothetical protein